jgi:hypothetical protein
MRQKEMLLQEMQRPFPGVLRERAPAQSKFFCFSGTAMLDGELPGK